MKTCGGDASRPLALLSLIKRENSGDQFFEMSKTSKLGFWKQTALLLRAWGLPDRPGRLVAVAPRQAGGSAPCDSALHGRAPPPPQEAWRAVLRCRPPAVHLLPKQAPSPRFLT